MLFKFLTAIGTEFGPRRKFPAAFFAFQLFLLIQAETAEGAEFGVCYHLFGTAGAALFRRDLVTALIAIARFRRGVDPAFGAGNRFDIDRFKVCLIGRESL